FALSFEDEAGQDLFTTLRAAEIVNWDQLAQGMGRSIQEVMRLRMEMPMDGATVADELRASRENVYKWRFRALRRLKLNWNDENIFAKLEDSGFSPVLDIVRNAAFQ